jgi:nucleoside-diphosphate-sugar epimerase
MKVVVTGSSGKAGRAVVAALLEHDYDVRAVDVATPADATAPFLLADLTEFGQTLECLAGADGSCTSRRSRRAGFARRRPLFEPTS